MPLRSVQRVFNYYCQNGCKRLTPKQNRRVEKKYRHWSNKDQSQYVS